MPVPETTATAPRTPWHRRNPRRNALLAVLLGSTALVGIGLHAAPPPAPPAVTLANPAPAAGFAGLVRQVRPAVVTVTTTGVQARGAGPGVEGRAMPGGEGRAMPGGEGRAMPGGEGRLMRGLGSGFLIDADGHIVTNDHVVDGAARLTVTLDDGRELPARVVGRDPRTDLALLKIEAGTPLPYVALADSDRAAPGDWVVAIGNPFGLGGSVTTGVVSAVGRNIGAGPYDDFIQVDAPINQGNSGGPLFAQDGGVIGVNTAIYSPTGGSVGIGFAVPSNLVRHVVAELQANGRVERGYLGITTQPVDAAMAAALRLPATADGAARGALVAGVERDSPAAAADLRPGDVVTAIDGKPVRNPGDLARAIAERKPGTRPTVTLWRAGAERQAAVEIAAPRDTADGKREAAATRPDRRPAASEGRLGLALGPITPRAREALGLPEGAVGAVIGEVAAGSPAAAAGLRRGDVIVGVGADAVTSAEAAVTAIREATAAGRPVALRLLRDGAIAFVAVPLGQG